MFACLYFVWSYTTYPIDIKLCIAIQVKGFYLPIKVLGLKGFSPSRY